MTRDSRVNMPPKDQMPSEGPINLDQSGLTWGVGAVSERLGIAASTLRTWERRYGIGPTHRTAGGHRRYTEQDIDRAEMVRRLVSRGVAAQDASRVVSDLDDDEVRAAIRQEHSTPVDAWCEDHIDDLIRLALDADEQRLDETVNRLVGRPVFLSVWTEVLSPFLARLAAEEAVGSLSAEAENLATTALLRALQGARPDDDGASESCDVLLVTDCSLEESLPVLALEAGLRERHAEVRFIGPEHAQAEARRHISDAAPRSAVVWSSTPHDWTWLQDAGIPLIVAAPSWPHEAKVNAMSAIEPVITDVRHLAEHVLRAIV